jgi:hypothetical protein
MTSKFNRRELVGQAACAALMLPAARSMGHIRGVWIRCGAQRAPRLSFTTKNGGSPSIRNPSCFMAPPKEGYGAKQ